MKIGIDLLWVRPGINGGTESYIRNLLDGFGGYDSENEYILFVAKDNAYSFQEYEEYDSMMLRECPTACANQAKRILWENLHLDRIAAKEGVDLMFVPVYSKPHTCGSKIPYVSVIHDLQAMHYPQYFSKIRRLFLQYTWRYVCKSSKHVVTISEYCKKDLIAHFPNVRDKCSVIYNPVEIGTSTLENAEMEKKYGIRAGEFFYCVSSMLPHKNLETLLKAVALCKAAGITLPLVISGVGGEKESFAQSVENLKLNELVVDTAFVTNEERDWLYENCKMFLFPSVFEGFGMPPVEAMSKGKPVIMTKESCLEEVTKGKAIYVDAPFNEKEWAEKVQWELKRMAEASKQKENATPIQFPEYEIENVVREYLKVFSLCKNF